MDIGLSSAVFYPKTTEEAVDTAIDLDFKKLEIFINSESEFSDIYIDMLFKRLSENNVEVVSVHPYTSVIEAMLFFSGYKRRLLESIEQYERYFRAASLLGAKYFVFHGARNLTADVLSDEEHFKAYEMLCDAAIRNGVLLCQENVSWCRSRDPEYLKALKSVLKDKVGFVLDMKQACRAGVGIDEYAAAMGENMKIIHISDSDNDNTCLLPGYGSQDYKLFLDLFRNSELIIEVYSTNYDSVQQLKYSKFLLMHQLF